MGKPNGATADFGVLRQYANHLTDCSELIDDVVQALRAGPVPGHVWGVAGAPSPPELNGRIAYPSAEGWDHPIGTVGDRAPELEKFKATYELAHAVTVERIEKLAQAYGRAGDLLRQTARQYEELEGVEPATPPPTPKDYRLPEVSNPIPDGGFDVAQGDRPSVWDMTGGRAVRDVLIRTGFGETLPMFDAYIGVNTEQMKWIAQMLYGRAENFGLNWAPNRCQVWPSDAFAPSALGEIPKRSNDFLDEEVEDYWDGPGFDAFVAYHDELMKATENEAFRVRRIGTALYDAAEIIERGKKKIEESLAGAAGMLLEGIDTVNTLRNKIDPFDIAIKVTQKALKAYQDAEEENAEKSAEAEQYAEGSGNLDDLVIAAPPTSKVLPELPEVDIDDWKRL